MLVIVTKRCRKTERRLYGTEIFKIEWSKFERVCLKRPPYIIQKSVKSLKNSRKKKFDGSIARIPERIALFDLLVIWELPVYSYFSHNSLQDCPFRTHDKSN